MTSDLGNDTNEDIFQLLEDAWNRYEKGDVRQAQRLAYRAYQIQPNIADNADIRPYLDTMFTNYNEDELNKPQPTWRTTFINLGKLGALNIILTIIYTIIFVIVLLPLQSQFLAQFQQLYLSRFSDIPNSTITQLNTNSVSQLNFSWEVIVPSIIFNTVFSTVLWCLFLLIRNSILHKVATFLLKGHANLHEFIDNTMRYEIVTLIFFVITNMVSSLFSLNYLLPQISVILSLTPANSIEEPTLIWQNLVILGIVLSVIGLIIWVIQLGWFVRIISKTYQFGWQKGCLTLVIPTILFFAAFACLCGVLSTVLAGQVAR